MFLFNYPQTVQPAAAATISETSYLVDLLELRPDVLLLPQTLTEAPVRRGKEEFVWMGNAERGRHR